MTFFQTDSSWLVVFVQWSKPIPKLYKKMFHFATGKISSISYVHQSCESWLSSLFSSITVKMTWPPTVVEYCKPSWELLLLLLLLLLSPQNNWQLPIPTGLMLWLPWLVVQIFWYVYKSILDYIVNVQRCCLVCTFPFCWQHIRDFVMMTIQLITTCLLLLSS